MLAYRFILNVAITSLAIRRSTPLMNHQLKLSLPDESNLRSSDIVALIKPFSELTSHSLKFLYDSSYEGTISSISKHSTFPSGMILHLYNNSESNLRKIIHSGKGMTLLLVLCSPDNILQIFQTVHKYTLHSHKMKWLLVMQGPRAPTEIIYQLQDYIFEGTEVVIFFKKTSDSFSFFSSRVNDLGLTRFDYKGTWNSENFNSRKILTNMNSSGNKSLYTDMSGRKLLVSAIESWPFLGLPKVSSDGTIMPPSGLKAHILQSLGSALNFTFEIVVPEDNKWGNPQPDGSVTGLMGMVARREANMALLVITSMRAKLIDYTLPFYREPLAIFTRAPTEKNRALAVFSPFTTLVWICLIAATIAIGPVLYVFSNTVEHTEIVKKQTLQDLAFIMFQMIVVQGNKHSFPNRPQSVLALSWSLFGLIISALYSGTLTAVLAIPAYETPVDFLEDLPRAVKEGFTLGVMEDSSNELLFREADSGIYEQTWELFNHKDRSQSFVNSPATGINRVLEKKFVYIGPRTYTESLATRLGRQKFHYGRSSFYPQGIVIALFPGTPYRDIFDELLLRMVEGGLVMKWRDNEIMTASSQQNLLVSDGDSKFKAITLTHLQAAFFVIALGSILATVVLLIENMAMFAATAS